MAGTEFQFLKYKGKQESWNGLLLLFKTIVFLAKYWKLKKVLFSNTTRGEAQ